MHPRHRLDEAWQKAGLRSQRCLDCDVCCRFASPAAHFIPFFSASEIAALGETARSRFLCPGRSPGERALAEPHGHGYRCPFLEPAARHCTVYGQRPLDCRLYPLVLMYDEPGTAVWLGADEVCPFAFESPARPEWQEAVEEAARLLDGPLADAVAAAPGLVSPFQDHIRLLRPLPEITRRVCRSGLGLGRLAATSRRGLEDFFRARPSCLTGHAFPAMYLWTDLFNLHWKVEADCLLVLAESDGVSFLMAPPLGEGDFGRALEAARELMAAINGPRGGARAQEVDEELLPRFLAAGWHVGHRATEYIASTEALASLRGRHFDGRRHDLRLFARRHQAAWRPYEAADLPQCVALLRRWQAERARRHPDAFYRDQLEATGFLHLRTLREAEELGLRGRVVVVGGQVAAYTFGFPLADGQTFADFIEVADLGLQGLPAFVFHEFCREALAYPFLNLGTDSELPSLAQAKLLYRPCRLVPSYILNAPQ